MDWRYDNIDSSFTLAIGPFIVARGILLTDITEATYMVKEATTDADVDALVTLTLGAGLTSVAGATEADATLAVSFSSGDYGTGALEAAGALYHTGLGIKVAGMTKFLEIGLDDNRLKIVPDFIHD